MSLRRVRELLWPGAAERDEGFLQEILRLSHLSLRVAGWAEIFVPLLLLLPLLVSDPSTHWILISQAVALIAIGVLTILVARLDWSYEYSRLLALCSLWLTSVVIVTASLGTASRLPGTNHYIPGRFTALMMIVITTIPLRPMQTFALGTAIASYYLGASLVMRSWGLLLPSELDAYDHLVIGTIIIIATALTAVVYDQRLSNYRTYLKVLQASADLRQAQSQMLLSESAASLGRLAAALSHELNNPLGVLKSSVNTLLLLGKRLATAPPEEHPKLLGLQAQLCATVDESAQRMHEIVGRMQRFTNLDRAEIQSSNLNELLTDVKAMVEPQIKGAVTIEMQLGHAPPVACRPQQLSAVFSNLIVNAVQACDGDGRVVISTRGLEKQAEVQITDTGRGMGAREVARVFDPGFKVEGGRVGTGNWSLFSSRQIINEHGGEIRVNSVEGEGTTVSVSLPYGRAT